MRIDATPLWEEAKKQTADGSSWAIHSRKIAAMLGAPEITNEQLKASYDPKWGKFFHFTAVHVFSEVNFELSFTRH